MNEIEQHIRNVALDNLIGLHCIHCGNQYKTRDDVIESNPRVISRAPWAFVDEECFSQWINDSYKKIEAMRSEIRFLEYTEVPSDILAKDVVKRFKDLLGDSAHNGGFVQAIV